MSDTAEKIVATIFDLAETDGGLVRDRAVAAVRMVLDAHSNFGLPEELSGRAIIEKAREKEARARAEAFINAMPFRMTDDEMKRVLTTGSLTRHVFVDTTNGDFVVRNIDLPDWTGRDT